MLKLSKDESQNPKQPRSAPARSEVGHKCVSASTQAWHNQASRIMRNPFVVYTDGRGRPHYKNHPAVSQDRN